MIVDQSFMDTTFFKHLCMQTRPDRSYTEKIIIKLLESSLKQENLEVMDFSHVLGKKPKETIKMFSFPVA